LAPRIEQAASQIHDSRDLLLFKFVAIKLLNFWEDLQVHILVKLRIARPRYARMFASLGWNLFALRTLILPQLIYLMPR